MMGPINEKLVPCMQSRPHPINPTRRHWMKVEMPDANNAIDTKYPVVFRSSVKAPAIIKGGVIIATKIASKCCKAAKRVSRKGGRSFSHISVRQMGGGLRFFHHSFILISQLSKLSMIASDSTCIPCSRK